MIFDPYNSAKDQRSGSYITFLLIFIIYGPSFEERSSSERAPYPDPPWADAAAGVAVAGHPPADSAPAQAPHLPAVEIHFCHHLHSVCLLRDTDILLIWVSLSFLQISHMTVPYLSLNLK